MTWSVCEMLKLPSRSSGNVAIEGTLMSKTGAEGFDIMIGRVSAVCTWFEVENADMAGQSMYALVEFERYDEANLHRHEVGNDGDIKT
jgi:hypothetical protein